MVEIKQFDVVRLHTTKNIRYVSAPPNVEPDPHGLWSVVGNLGKDLLICKGVSVCRVPIQDAYLVSTSPTEQVLEKIDGKGQDRKK